MLTFGHSDFSLPIFKGKFYREDGSILNQPNHSRYSALPNQVC